MKRAVKVRVPGTSANCGPGFDAIGVACTIYNELELVLTEEKKVSIEITGEGSCIIPRDYKNIAYQSILSVFQRIHYRHEGIRMRMHNQIPLARGLGSSAAAIVAALVAANLVTGQQLSQQEILEMATAAEGHPDNVAPAIFGGVSISVVNNGGVQTLKILPPLPLNLVIAVPEFGLSTKTARQVLPKTVSLKDAVFNVSRASLLVGALGQGQYQFLRAALEDKMHQPYRSKLIPGMTEVFQAAVAAGAFGAVISGAGSCLAAYTAERAVPVGEAMVAAFAKHGVRSRYLVLDIDTEGAREVH